MLCPLHSRVFTYEDGKFVSFSWFFFLTPYARFSTTRIALLVSTRREQ